MIAIVTGGTKGIGKAVCDIFIRNGHDLFVCARSKNDLEAMKMEYMKSFPQRKVHISKVDMSKKEEVKKFAQNIRDKVDHIDVLVNNAGAFIPGQILSEEEGTLEKLIETNLYSAYYMTRGLIDIMVNEKSGHIFNMCSIASFMAYPNGGSYAISKFALRGFSKSIREELKESGVKVTTVMPGATWSNSWAGVDLPDERLMKATDVAKSIWSAYDLSDAAVVEDIVLRPQLGDL